MIFLIMAVDRQVGVFTCSISCELEDYWFDVKDPTYSIGVNRSDWRIHEVFT